MSDNSGLDQQSLRKALGCFATGITLVTTRTADGTPIGVTMNSFSSVSLDPPLVLFSLAKTSDQYDHFMAASNFGISILGLDQQDISNKHGVTDERTLDPSGFQTWSTDCPILNGCIAAFETTVDQRIEGGDHIIFICRVLQAEIFSDAEPLIYNRSGYARLQPAG